MGYSRFKQKIPGPYFRAASFARQVAGNRPLAARSPPAIRQQGYNPTIQKEYHTFLLMASIFSHTTQEHVPSLLQPAPEDDRKRSKRRTLRPSGKVMLLRPSPERDFRVEQSDVGKSRLRAEQPHPRRCTGGVRSSAIFAPDTRAWEKSQARSAREHQTAPAMEKGRCRSAVSRTPVRGERISPL